MKIHHSAALVKIKRRLFLAFFMKKNLAFFCSNHLKHRQAGLGECVKMTSGLDSIGELATEYLHPQQGENENEQEEDYEQGIN